MDIPFSIIRNTFSGVEYSIPKVNKDVLYICLQSDCGEQVTSQIVAAGLGGRYTGSKICPGCGVALWKIIK